MIYDCSCKNIYRSIWDTDYDVYVDYALVRIVSYDHIMYTDWYIEVQLEMKSIPYMMWLISVGRRAKRQYVNRY